MKIASSHLACFSVGCCHSVLPAMSLMKFAFLVAAPLRDFSSGKTARSRSSAAAHRHRKIPGGKSRRCASSARPFSTPRVENDLRHRCRNISVPRSRRCSFRSRWRYRETTVLRQRIIASSPSLRRARAPSYSELNWRKNVAIFLATGSFNVLMTPPARIFPARHRHMSSPAIAGGQKSRGRARR